MSTGRFHKEKVGEKFHKLLLLERTPKKAPNGSWIYKCKCDCGTEREIPFSRISNGRSKSCGCLRSPSGSKSPLFKHGLSLKSHPEYKRYQRECFDRTKYNLEPEAKAKMIADQKNQCAICGYSFGQKKGDMKVDHCHKTKAVRGLLCDHCNRGLGFFKENIKSLEGAIAYLEKNSVMLIS